MQKRFLTAFTLCGLLLSHQAPADNAVSPLAEFKRALSIIEQTQLKIFTDVTPATPKEVLSGLSQPLTEAADGESIEATEQTLLLLRDELSKTIDSYNDQYANYITPAELKKYRERRTGSYHGVGLKFRAMQDDYPVVIGPITGGPLDNSNLQPGDQIVQAGTSDLHGASSSDVVNLLKGPKDSIVNLTIRRDGNSHKVEAHRGPVALHYVRSEIINNNIGYLKISRFGGKTHERARQHLKALLKKSVKGFVLDLRDNPGGSTRAARSVVSMFTTEQHVYCERYKSGAVKKLPRHGDHLTDLPLAVLVNGQSMSSSEIVAGALQAYERATIIGAPTFGKGLVQKVFNLAPPLGGAIRTTIAVFGTPDEKPIHATGIVPDLYTESEAGFMFRRTGSLNIQDNARRYQRKLLEQRVTIDFPDKADEYINADDVQLETAINILEQTTRVSELQTE